MRAGFDLSDRQRPDLNLESFKFATLGASGQLAFVPTGYLRASITLGIERRLLFSPVAAAGEIPPMSIVPLAQTRLFGELGLKLTFDPESLRLDHHHQVTLAARAYTPPHADSDGALHLDLRWQKFFPFGWHELWFEALGISRTGFVLFPEEVSIGGDALRGPFGTEYARQQAAFQTEFRYSLLRDVFKLGLFNNVVAYGRIDRTTNAQSAALADGIGVGFHALLIDEFALDAYYSIGFATGNRFDRGASLSIRQAF
jgi:hypothetical protein